MKSQHIALGVIAAAAALLTTAAQASDGTITITGAVTATTCTINGGGAASSFTVPLPTVSTSALPANGATAGRTAFKIALTGCTPTTGTVATYFEPGTQVDLTTNRLKNGGTATNVQVGVLNGDDMSAVLVGAAQASQNSHSASITAGAATLNYYAQYVATGGAAGAGSVNTSVTYTLIYS
jgi:major type 1 subunit fimbrin (pilin)